jgi:hypothetical protein
MAAKSEQLQIRVTRAQKAALKRLAGAAGQDVSAYVLSRTLSESRDRFNNVIRALDAGDDGRFPLAELNDLLSGLTSTELADAVTATPAEFPELTPFMQNYVAAMIEQACYQRDMPPPVWVRDVPPLDRPWFVIPLRGLRLHLLRGAPVPFKRRNIFIDAGVGARV